MEAWKHIVNAALLGTEKAQNGPALLQQSADFDALLEKVNVRSADPETKILDTVAALYLYRRCGVQPLSEEAEAKTADSETNPYCSEAAGKVLVRILKTGSTGLLRFWLQKCAAGSQVLPPELLPEIFRLAVQHQELQALVNAPAGKRGEWLRTLNPDWNFGATASEEDVWETGTTAQRTVFIGNLRTTAPLQARTLLEAVWSNEKADVREAFLGTLSHNPIAEDLPFLEKASTDKGKKVKALAFELLMRIPESTAVAAFEDFLRGAVQLQTTKKLLGLVNKTSLEIKTVKGEAPLITVIDRKGKGLQNVSDGTFEIVQAIGFVPPAFWESHLRSEPEKIIALFEETPHAEFYLNALQEGTIRFADRRWAALLAGKATEHNMDLVPLLSPAEANTYLLQNAKAHPAAVLEYYTEKDTDWPAPIAPDLLRYIVANPYQYNRKFFNSYAHLIPGSLLPALPTFEPKKAASANDYAAQQWEHTRDTLTELLTLKEQTINVFGDG